MRPSAASLIRVGEPAVLVLAADPRNSADVLCARHRYWHRRSRGLVYEVLQMLTVICGCADTGRADVGQRMAFAVADLRALWQGWYPRWLGRWIGRNSPLGVCVLVVVDRLVKFY